jgi:hypothetical protein
MCGVPEVIQARLSPKLVDEQQVDCCGDGAERDPEVAWKAELQVRQARDGCPDCHDDHCELSRQSRPGVSPCCVGAMCDKALEFGFYLHALRNAQHFRSMCLKIRVEVQWKGKSDKEKERVKVDTC